MVFPGCTKSTWPSREVITTMPVASPTRDSDIFEDPLLERTILLETTLRVRLWPLVPGRRAATVVAGPGGGT